MSKIICDICGTTYQDTADCCPICGCTPEAAAELLGADVAMEETVDVDKGSRLSTKKKKEIFDYDEVNGAAEEVEDEEDEDSYDEEEDEEEEEPRHNTFLVILLTVIIVALLAAAAFIFVRYFLPNMGSEETVPSTVSQQQEQTEPPTTEFAIPCQSLALTSGKTAELNPGGYFLLNVVVDPADTTDQLVFTSADENIATVTEDGKITAVAEGQTVIYITCGDIQLTCDVICNFVEETEAPTEETAAAAEGEAAAETGAEESATEETTAATAAPDVVLKIKKSDLDFMLKAPYSHQIELDCDLNLEDVEWSVAHEYIASVKDGYVTALQAGTTVVIAKYGDQEIKCYVRCY